MMGHSGKLAIVGNSSGTNIGDSLRRAAAAAGICASFFDAYEASRGSRLIRALKWRLMDRRPLKLVSFSEAVVNACAKEQPSVLIATGTAPLTGFALQELRRLNILCANYSTDDPWNPAQRAGWFFEALRRYDLVFTTRRNNIDDFHALGCKDVRYLPFGYDELLFACHEDLESCAAEQHEVLFVGGADRDRAAFMARLRRSGVRPALVGDYWYRYAETRDCELGYKDPKQLRTLTAAAAVNLCLVRRANRDGNVMRSFEIPAVGGFMLAEDTAEHREIFGDEGQCVLYFKTPEAAAEKARWALVNPHERERMARAAHELIISGKHTYRDRLLQMLAAAKG